MDGENKDQNLKRRRRTAYEKSNLIYRVVAYTVTVIFIILLYFPIYWLFTSMTKDPIEAAQVPPKLFFSMPNDFRIELNTEDSDAYKGKSEDEQNEQFTYEALVVLWMTMDRGMNLNCNSLEVVRVENDRILSRATLKNLTYSEWRNKTKKIEDDYYERLLFADAVSERIIRRWKDNGDVRYQRLKELLKQDGFEVGLNEAYKAKTYSAITEDKVLKIHNYLDGVTNPASDTYKYLSDREKITGVTAKIGEISYSKNFIGTFNAFARAIKSYASEEISFFRYLLNSVSISLISVITLCFFTGVFAYAMACLLPRNVSQIFFYFLMVTMMIPGVVNLLPMQNLYNSLGWKNTYWPFLFMNMGSSWWIIVFRGVFGVMAKELREAAKIDGAGEIRIYFQIMIPLAQSMFAVLALRTFIASWNSYFWENLLLTKQEMWNLTLVVRNSMTKTDVSGRKDVSVNMAMAMIAALPTMFIFAFLQKYLVKGLTFEGLKG